jgi:hypothetical protein
MLDLSHKPVVLYHASLQRNAEAFRAFESKEHVLSMYVAGLGVECVLQALALRGGSPHDARHSLANWLARCPATLQDIINRDSSTQWNQLLALWSNGLRYLSDEGLLGYLREKGATRGIRGGPLSILRVNAKRLLDAADDIHKKGVAQWLTSARR